MAAKNRWEEYKEQQTAKQSNGQQDNGQQRETKKNRWEEYKEKYGGTQYRGDINTVANNIVESVNAWLTKHNAYVYRYKNRYANRKYSYEDAYVSDSGSWLDTVSKQKSNFDAEADSILAYMDQFSGYLDADWMKSVRDTLTSASKQQSRIVEGATKDNEWWSSFGSEDLVKQYGSAEEAYKTHQRYDGYSKKYNGMTSADLGDLLKDLDDGEEKDWLTSHKASVYRDEMLKYDVAGNEENLGKLEQILSQYDNLRQYYDAYQKNPDAYSGSEFENHRTMAEIYSQYLQTFGSKEELEKLVHDTRLNINNAKRIKKNAELSSVADSTSKNYDPEFGKYSIYVDDGETPLIPDYKDIAYDAVNGNVDSFGLAVGQSRFGPISGSELQRLDAIRYMDEDEKALYNYYYNKHGYEAAEEYLDTIIDSLNYLHGKKIFEPMENKWLLEELFGIVAGFDQFYSGITSFLSGDDYIPTSAIQYASGMVREDLADTSIPLWYNFKTGKWEDKILGNSLGQGAYDLITTTSNMAPSILTSMAVSTINPTLGAVAGNALMGVSSAGNAYQEALNLGYDKGQARVYSTLVGASEVGLQYLIGGIGKLGGKLSGKAATSLASKFDKAYARLAVKYGTNMLAEGTEEYLQEILTPVFKNLALGTDEKISLITEDAIYSFLLGAISSGFMEGTGISSSTGKGLIGNIRDISSKNQANIDAANLYGGSTKELIEEGLKSESGSESRQLAEIMKRKTGRGKEMSGYEIRSLVEANEAQFAVEDYDAAVKTAKEKLVKLGESKNIDKIAKLVAKRATGQELTRLEKSTLVRSQFGAQVAKEMTTPVVETQSGPKSYNATYKSLEDRVGTESRFGVSESGKAVIRKSNEEISLDNVEVVKTEDGQLTVKLADGQELYAGDIDFADDTQAYAFSAVADIENITPAAATAILRDLDLSKPVGAQLNGIDEAYTYGYHGYSEADLKAGQYTSNLTNEQMMSAYKLGQSARKISDVDADAPVVKMRTAAEAKMTAEQKTAQQKKRIESKDVEVYFEDGKTVVKFDEHTGKYDDKRMAAVNTAKFLSKLGIGGKYYFFASYVNDDGVRVYKDSNGNEVEAPNGMYKDADGSIHIDLNAGDYGQGTALFTMGHELTHFIKAQSKKQFKVLCDLVAEAFDKTNLSMHERVVEKQEFLSEKRGYHVSYNEALEEVVADAMSTMLTDGSFYEKLMEIKVKDKGLFNTIKRFFRKMIAKFQNAYEGLTPDQQYARDIQDMKEMFDRIQTAFAEALVEASENFQAAMESVVEAKAEAISTDEIVTDGAVVTDGNGERFSIRSMKHDIAEGKMFEDLKNVCGWTNTQVNTLKTQLQDLVEYMIPYRNILDMNETYGMEGRRFSPYKPNSDPLYKISMDFSTLCSKRLLTQYVIENLQLRENRPMSAEEQMAIRDMLNEYRKVEKGLQVACAMCYVEAARLKSPKQVQRWLNDPAPLLKDYFGKKNTEFNDAVKKAQSDFKESKGYDREAPKKDMKHADVKELNKIGPKMRTQYQMSAEEQVIVERAKSLPNSTYLTAGNLANLMETDPVIYDAYTAFVRTATRSKSLETDEPYYYGDSRRDNGNGIIVSDSFIEAVNRENGMRFSSWSDWRIQHLLDYITAVIDNSVRGAAMHGYTKFGDEVRVLGKTGMMFNMSGVAGTQTGLNEDGSLSFSPTESIDVNEAIQLREEFPEHAGLQCIGVGDEHIIALLRSDIIDYVIPYHVSGLNAALRRMADIHGWKDYTGTQHAAIDKSIKLEDAVDKEHWHEEPVFSEFFVGYDTGMTGIEAMRASAEKYKQMCKDRGLTPKFNQFATEDNYWKLLIDRKMINQQTGKLIQQRAVTPTFDFDTIKGVVDKFVDNYDAGLEGRALNHIVKNWDSIPQRIKDLKKQSSTKAKKTAKVVDTLSNQTLAAQPTKNSDRQNKNRASNGSPLTRRSVKQRSVGSTHIKMSSTAAAEILGIENIAKYSDPVKEAVAVLGELFTSVDQKKPVLGFKRPVSASSLEGALVAQGILKREGTSGSAYRYDDGHALRISNHSANANNFVGDGEHLSIALFERGKMNDFVEGESNVIEAVFRQRYLDGNPEVLKQVIHDIAHFIAEGEYHDTAGAMRYNFSGTETFKENARKRLAKDEIARGQKFSDRDSNGKLLGEDQLEYFEKSMARDRSGRLQVVYHGGTVEYEFDTARGGKGETQYGPGSYFTDAKGYADEYLYYRGGTTKEYYLNIERMFDDTNMGATSQMPEWKKLEQILRNNGIEEKFIKRFAEEGFAYMSRYLAIKAGAKTSGSWEGSEQLNAMLREAGFDGIKGYLNDAYQYAIFTPNQAKLTTNEVPSTFYDTRYSERNNAPTFYSQMGKVVDGMKQEKFGASSVISMLRGKGVKAEEIRWSGIQAFLDGKKSVSKAELQEFIAGSMLQIEEQVRDKKKPSNLKVKDLPNGAKGLYSDGKLVETFTADEDGLLYPSNSKDKGIWYSNAKEILADYDSSGVNTKWSEYKLDGGKNYREIVFKLPNSTYSNSAMQGHWGIDAKGILAHARLQDFKVNGKKMLFIEEIQSDWHNAGHKEGYITESKEKTTADIRHDSADAFREFSNSDVISSIESRLTRSGYADTVRVIEGLFDGKQFAYDAVADQIGTLTSKEKSFIENAAKEEANRQAALETAPEPSKGTVPDAPFRDNYHEFVLKRLLREATEKGYDSIGWTTADIQSERWSEMYAEGYRIEYDQDMPKFLKKYGKQWGAEVGKTTLKNDTEVWSMGITPAMKQSVLTEGQALYSERGEDTSNRALLANAFEGLSRNSDEYKMIQEYKGRVKLLNEQEEKLARLNAEIREIRFTEGKYDAKKLKMLEAEAKSVAESINRQDKKLLDMEVSEPFRKVIEQERKKEAQKTKDHIKEIQQNKKLRAEQTELRHKIRKAVRDLDKLLNRGNKKLNVKEDMKGFASKALELADYLFTDHISNDELIRKGITVRMTPKEAALVTETEDILTKLYDHADSLTDEEFTRLDAKRKANEDKLRDLLTAQRNERLSTPVYQLFDDLVKAYASLKNSSQDAVKAAYDEELEKSLRAFMSDDARVKILENMRVADMTTEELNWLYRAYTMVLNNVRNANKFHVKGMTETIDQKVGRIVSDFGNRKIPDGKVAIVARNLANKIGWDYEKLYYALDRIGSEAFTELIMNLANSENIVMQDVKEAIAFRNEMVEKYGFNDWEVNKKIDKEFLDNTGKKFKLTLGELMSLYAYSRREGAWDHIEYGGFSFKDTPITENNSAASYKLSKAQCEAITNTLTKEQKAYVEDMQKFLSETMGAKGNEVSMMLYGIKMFGEKNYFPIHIDGRFMAQAKESQAKAAAGFGTMSNAGFTHAQNPNAKAPFVMEGFNEVWADHVNEMSRYHGAVPALEDIRRVMNRSSYSDAYNDSMSVQTVMENAFGKDAVDYFDNLYREANSGAIQDKLQRKSKKLLSLFRKGSVAYSLSVVIQQPSAIKRAYAMIDPKYFGFKGFGALTSGVAKAVTSKWNKAYSDTYNKMLKYAPGVTLAKEIGGFDTHTGTSIREYLLDTNKSFKQKLKTGTVTEKGKAVLDVVDNNAIANLPNVADKIAWMEIWNACERETVAKHKDLTPGGDEFLQTVGDRFTEVIRATQVYDSIFAKSPMLKSKNLAVQYLVSFMNEPNTTANMVEKAVRDAAKGDWKSGFRTAAVVTYSIIFNNVLKSIIYAMRDDDEDETYQEKYIEAIVGNLMSDFNPLSYIPIARDAWSIAQGYDVERADMAIIADAMDALGQVIKNGFTDTEEMNDEQLAAFDKKVIEANWKLVESMAAFFGIPVKNIRREINAVFDHARIASANAGLTTDQSRWDTIYDAVLDSIPFVSGNRSKQDKLYDALVSGDTVYVNRLKAGYKDDDAYNSAVRKALRDNDPRIHEAALAYYNGNIAEYKRIFKEIRNDDKQNIIGFDNTMEAVMSEVSAIKGELNEKTESSSYNATDFVNAILVGSTDLAQAMKEDIISYKVDHGSTRADAEDAFADSVATSTRNAFDSGLLDEAGTEKMLQEYAGMDEEEAAEKTSYWSFMKAHSQYRGNLSQSNVEDYHEFAEPAEIPLDVFVQFLNGTKGLGTKYDQWGDVEKTKKEQVLEVIDSLPLTWQQKDALYLAAGYAESGLWDVPW